jgi:stearoyl-CoA desaturase (delta-9 desaturase)
VWDLKTPPEEVLRNEQRLGSRVISRAAEELAARFNPGGIAHAIESALHAPDLQALRERLARTQQGAAEVFSGWHLPHLPSREQLLAEARAMFARTRSLDEIVDRAYEMLLASVGTRLAAPAERPT